MIVNNQQLIQSNKKVEQIDIILKSVSKDNMLKEVQNYQEKQEDYSNYQNKINFDSEDHFELSKFPLKREDSMLTESLETEEKQESQIQKIQDSFDSMKINFDHQSTVEQNNFQIRSQSKQFLTPFLKTKRSTQFKSNTDGVSTSSVLTPNLRDRKNSLLRKSKILSIANLLLNVRLFIDKLQINLRVNRKLTQIQHDSINDASSTFGNQKQKKQFFEKCKLDILIQKILMKISEIPVFSPHSIQKRIWDYFQFLVILILFYLISLSLFFNLTIQHSILDFYKLSLVVFIIDMLTTFNTAVVQKGSINYNRINIAAAYIKKYLLSDILGNLSLMIFIPLHSSYPDYHKLIQIFILTKWVKIRDIFQRLSFYLCYETNQKNILDILRLLFLLIGISHTFCCFWHGLAMYQISIGKQNTWLNQQNIVNDSIMVRYIYSFYFLSVTMITVGYGDITPQNPPEIIFTIATMFVTGIVYAFCLNTIGFMIGDIEKKDKNYKENMQAIHQLMREENVNDQLRTKVSNYLEYLHRVINYFQLVNPNFEFQFRVNKFQRVFYGIIYQLKIFFILPNFLMRKLAD